MKNKIILHNKNISLYLFSKFLNECKTKTNCKTESYFLLCSTQKTVTFSMWIHDGWEPLPQTLSELSSVRHCFEAGAGVDKIVS